MSEALADGSTGPVAEWFARRTSDIDDWPLDRVAAAKAGTSVAVVLPARNEEATVGEIVGAIRNELTVGSQPVVDEVIVVDSGSEDATAHVAEDRGARVLALGDVLAGFPPRAGKGEAMWRGLAATAADVVVFVDADLQSFDPRFVVALLGPLLADPTVQFVKAAYDRPPTDPAVPSNGGGRVTELMARPWLAAFWPELAGVLQPLAGEYAARGSLLRRLPFRCGYGVDLGLLIDTYSLAGLDAIAQVDLRRRWHRHSDLPSLGRMASEVMLTAVDRLRADSRLPADVDAATLLWQPQRLEGSVAMQVHEIDTAERPPLDSVG
ncbi:MAG TPA: glucosyl-3-phosphoglycerate synthase [Mycobacteriales bacterium]|nr:glucosyl-3-phosphoglycerate synthase [Mycobacteriales bacterium]